MQGLCGGNIQLAYNRLKESNYVDGSPLYIIPSMASHCSQDQYDCIILRTKSVPFFSAKSCKTDCNHCIKSLNSYVSLFIAIDN